MASVRLALDRLSAAQKTPRGVSIYSRWVNRPLGRVLAAIAYAVGWTPHRVTALSAVFTFSGAALIVLLPGWSLVGIFSSMLLVLGFALDSADGQLARLTGSSSRSGEWLDHVVDSAKMVVVHAAVLVAWFQQALAPELLVLPLVFQLVAVVMFTGGTLVPLLRGTADSFPAGRSRWRAWALLPADYGVFALSVCLLGWSSIYVPVYALLLVANLLVLGMLLLKWFRELASADAR